MNKTTIQRAEEIAHKVYSQGYGDAAVKYVPADPSDWMTTEQATAAILSLIAEHLHECTCHQGETECRVGCCPCHVGTARDAAPNQPTNQDELTFERQQEITAILENYRSNPSNSNKFRYELFAYVDNLIATHDAQKKAKLLEAVGPDALHKTCPCAADHINQERARLRQHIEQIYGGKE